MLQHKNSLLILLLLFGLVGCVSNPAEDGNDATAASEPETTAAPNASAPAQGLSDFVGARAGQAELGLQNRGYQHYRSEGLTSYWLNAATGECAEIVTADGRYTSADMVSPAECGADAASAPTAAQQACIAAVRSETNNDEVTVLGSEFSEAGTMVQLGVGPENAPWQCIAYADGSTDGVQFLGDEGAL